MRMTVAEVIKNTTEYLFKWVSSHDTVIITPTRSLEMVEEDYINDCTLAAIPMANYLDENNLQGKIKLIKPYLILKQLPRVIFGREIIWL